MSGPLIGDPGPWPTFEPGQTGFAVNSIYDVSPSFLGDLSAYFTMNPFPVPLEQVTGYGASPRVLVDSGEIAVAQATIDLPNVPNDYFGLALRYLARSDGAAASTRLQMIFNGDNAGTSYHSTVANRNGATLASIITNHGLATMSISSIPAATSTQAALAGTGLIEIPGYTSSLFTKTATCKGTLELDWTLDAQLFDILGAGHWNQTAPITQVTLQPAVGNFVAGSRIVLYGF